VDDTKPEGLEDPSHFQVRSSPGKKEQQVLKELLYAIAINYCHKYNQERQNMRFFKNKKKVQNAKQEETVVKKKVGGSAKNPRECARNKCGREKPVQGIGPKENSPIQIRNRIRVHIQRKNPDTTAMSNEPAAIETAPRLRDAAPIAALEPVEEVVDPVPEEVALVVVPLMVLASIWKAVKLFGESATAFTAKTIPSPQ